jgi:hypothetical protein
VRRTLTTAGILLGSDRHSRGGAPARRVETASPVAPQPAVGRQALRRLRRHRLGEL